MTTTNQQLPPPQPHLYITLHNQHGERFLLTRRNHAARAHLLSCYVSEHLIDYSIDDDFEDYADYADFLLSMLGTKIPNIITNAARWWNTPEEVADYFGRYTDPNVA